MDNISLVPSEPLGDEDNINYIIIVLYIPVFLLALIANLLVIAVVIKYHYMRNVTNYFLVNLSIADLLVTLVCMPNGALQAYTHFWWFGEVACKLTNYLQCISVASSVFTMTAMAMDRYLAITKPFGFYRWFTKKSTILIIIVMWISFMIIFSPLLIVSVVDTYTIPLNDGDYELSFCYENWNRSIASDYVVPKLVFSSLLFIIMFAIPGIIILWTYSMMGMKLCSGRPPFDNNSNNSISTQQGFRLVRERKRVAWILLLLVHMFACCWLPYNTFLLLSDIKVIEKSEYWNLFLYMLLLGHMNSALNPIIYCIMSKNFRKSVAQILCSKTSRNNLDIRSNQGHARVRRIGIELEVSIGFAVRTV